MPATLAELQEKAEEVFIRLGRCVLHQLLLPSLQSYLRGRRGEGETKTGHNAREKKG